MGADTFLGIDLGIGSCGWALTTDASVIALGTRTFDVPETDKTRTPTNQLRRTARGMRRVTTRRRQRMNEVRALLHRHGLTEDDGKTALADTVDPWQMRAEGLDRPLRPRELALALGHIAKHRGFRSNSKRDRGANAPDEQSKMLAAVDKVKDASAEWRSIGEMFWKADQFRDRKRNRDGDFSRSVLRSDLEREVQLLLRRQRALGNALASVVLERDFLDTAFFQRPLADSEDMVGFCPFEPDEKRAPKHSPSFERFRLLTRLATLRIDGRALTADKIAIASRDFGRQQGLTYKRLRSILSLPAAHRFLGVPIEEEAKRDVVARSGTGKAAPGSAALYKVLGEAGWQSLGKNPEVLDRIAAILAFRDDAGRILAGLEELDLAEPILAALMRGVEDGAFGAFKGAGHISAKACRALLPFLAQGLDYSEACRKIPGYDHAARPETDIDSLGNPIAKKAVREALKQIKAVVQTYGKPTYIHIELARAVGKSLEERNKITAGLDRRKAEKERSREQFIKAVGQEPTDEDLMRYELWMEQGHFCLYTGDPIPVDALLSDKHLLEVDHILPWSLSGDDSFLNKTLCFTKTNRDKKGRIPFDWFGKDDAERWRIFTARVEACHTMKGTKKRNFLMKDASVVEQKFRPRNLTDTSYACRLLLNILKSDRDYGATDVFALPGQLTNRLRHAWGLQGLKKDSKGQRIADDRHHALDALIVALTSQERLKNLIELFHEAESLGLPAKLHDVDNLARLYRDRGGLPRGFAHFRQPWPGFRDDVINHLQTITVSRAERHRARGEGHAATIRQVKERDGQEVVFERKAIAALTEKDLERIKDADRNAPLVTALRQWVAQGKSKTAPPLSPKGDPIRKVRLETNKKVDVPVRGGAAERGEMTRIDVFGKANKKGKNEYYLVPIYPHQVADRKQFPNPPDRAVLANTPEEEWPPIDDGHDFLWSLYPLCWIEVQKADGEIIEGYFRGMDRNTGAILISPHYTNTIVRKGIGAKTLVSFRKFAMDRLGNRFEILKETRTWHGEACT